MACNYVGPAFAIFLSPWANYMKDDSITLIKLTAQSEKYAKSTMKESIKIIYLAGWGRSGSTLLARILGQVEGVEHLGELRTLWTDGFKPKSQCGCGKPTRECDVWVSVLAEAFGGLDQIDLPSMVQLRRQSEPRTSELLKLSWSRQYRNAFLEKSTEYRQVLEKLYSSLQKVCEAEAIVDDSLHPGYAYTLAHTQNVEVYLVHLVRDVRGCAYSWTKRHKNGLGSYSLKDSILGWNLRNFSTEWATSQSKMHYMRLRYEDLIDNPEKEVRSILDFSHIDSNHLPFKSKNEVFLDITHSIFGNDNRSKVGSVLLRSDEVWKEKMSYLDQSKANLVSWPLLLRYGYY